MKKRHYNIGIIAFPICESGDVTDDTRAGNIPFSNLVDILHNLSDNLYVLTGNRERVQFKENEETHVFEVQHRGGAGFIGRIIGYIITQIKLSRELDRLSDKVDLWIYFIGAESLLLPMLVARLRRKQIVLALSGFPAGISREERTSLFKITDILLRINLALSDGIIVYSERIIAERNLERYRNKISLAREHFLDFKRFKSKVHINRREKLVAYIGRLTEGKGVSEFVEALGRISRNRDDINFLIGGDGPLREHIEEYLEENDLSSSIRMVGWIPHDKLPDYLNEIRLLVLPSYTEALPNIILEAMACGTPVLSTAVGAIPDIIKDGETGFIMEANSPDVIAVNIIRAVENPDLEKIAGKARQIIEDEYTYETAVARYGRFLDALEG